MEHWNLNDWLAWMERSHPSEIELGLDRVNQVLDRLAADVGVDGAFLADVPVVTVAGTNGKGSTIAALEAMLREQGYRVGCYTSPHLLRYNERVAIDGQPVSDALLCDAFAQVAAAQGGISLTYFEIGTLAAFLILQQAGLDAVLLEVGMGGRLDVVNCIDPDVAVITSIALDHQQWLGQTREAIAREKCGILRPGRPAICGEADAPVTVRECAQACGAQLHWRGVDFDGADDEPGQGRWSWRGIGRDGKPVSLTGLARPALPMPSVITALQALHCLSLPVAPEAIRAGLRRARLPGRQQTQLYRGVPVVLDVAHNPAAATLLARSLPAIDGQTHAVLAMLADKDAAGVVGALASGVDRWHLPNLTGTGRALATASLHQTLREQDILAVDLYDDVKAALDAASAACQPGDRVLVTGSFFTVAAALPLFDDSEE